MASVYNEKKKESTTQSASKSTSGSATSGIITGGDSYLDSIKDQMQANSDAWHQTTDQAEKDRLHQENVNLAGILNDKDGSVKYDPATGKWSGYADSGYWIFPEDGALSQAANSGGGGGGGGGSSWGGSSGSGMFPSFSYGSAPQYTSQWNSIIQDLANQILNRPAFEYDYKTDPSYQQYKDAYTREGERAMQDTLGELAARTGGMASSYAASAASQANNYYMSQLADKIPELRQMAYEAYQTNLANQLNDLSMLMGLENMNYNQYLGTLGQWNTDRNFNYGVYSDDRNWQYQLGRDEINDQRYENEWNYGVQQDQWNKDLQAAQLLASVGDFSGFSSLFGLSDASTQALVNDYAEQKNLSKQQAAMELADWYAQHGDFSKLKEFGVDTSYLQFMQNMDYMSAIGGGSSSSKASSSSGGGYSGGSGSKDAVDIVSHMLSLGNDSAAKQYLLGLNLSQWEYNEYMDMYNAAKKQSNPNPIIDIKPSSSTNPFDTLWDLAGQVASGANQGVNGVTNQNDESWVRVSGYGRLTWQELEAMVNRGEIIETFDPKTGNYSYKKNPNYNG